MPKIKFAGLPKGFEIWRSYADTKGNYKYRLVNVSSNNLTPLCFGEWDRIPTKLECWEAIGGRREGNDSA